MKGFQHQDYKFNEQINQPRRSQRPHLHLNDKVYVYLKVFKCGKHIRFVYLQLDVQTPPFHFQID